MQFFFAVSVCVWKCALMVLICVGFCNFQSKEKYLIALPFFCSNIFTPSRLRSRRKCPDMLLYMVLVWKHYQWRNWRHWPVSMKKGLGRFMPSNSTKGVQLAVLLWALTPFSTPMGCTLLHHLQWLLDCPLLSFQMVLGSTAMGMWMGQLDPGSTIIES